MKKIILSISMIFLFAFNANAEKGINVGLALTAGVFEVEGAKETFTGTHSSGAGSTVTKNASDEGDVAEGLFAIGSIFVEKTLGDILTIGLDYVPHSLDSETAENITNKAGSNVAAVLMDSAATNTVQVDFEDLTTFYAMINFNENVYLKAGVVTVDVITNETLNTGSSYGNTDLDGTMFAIGYSRDLDNGAFVRFEGSIMDLDGTTLTSTVDSAKSVSVDGIEGLGAKLSIGKSF
jgi:hypothetical protein